MKSERERRELVAIKARDVDRREGVGHHTCPARGAPSRRRRVAWLAAALVLTAIAAAMWQFGPWVGRRVSRRRRRELTLLLAAAGQQAEREAAFRRILSQAQQLR